LKINVFGKQLDAYDVGTTIIDGKRVPKQYDPNVPSTLITQGIDDLSIETLQTLANYASDLTHGNQNAPASNDFPVEPGIRIFDTKDNNNRPSTPQPIASQANGTQYIDVITSVEAFTNSAPNKNLVKKGRESKGEINGNKLLRDNVERVYTDYTLPMLKNNRFRPRDGFKTPEVDGNTPGTFSSGNEATYHVNVDKSKQTLGSYNTYNNTTKELVAGHMSLVGPMLSLRSTRELGAATTNGYGQDGPDGATADASALLPGITQAGAAKVNTNDLSAIDALSSLIKGDASPANLDPDNFFSKHTVISFSRDSYGNMNNINEPFSGIAPLGTIALATALVIVLKQAMRGVLLIFGSITNATSTAKSKKSSNNRYILGHYIVSAGGGSKNLFSGRLPSSVFGLIQTNHDYNDSVNAGLEAFFGSGIGDLSKVLASPGFYATLCRVIVRSSTEIVDSVRSALKGNPIHVIENIIGLVDVIKSSKIIGALNVFAQIGDNALNLQDNPNYLAKTLVNGEEIVDARTLSRIDAIDDKNSSGYKNRTSDGVSLAWRAGGTATSMIVPQSLSKAIGLYSRQSGADKSIDAKTIKHYTSYNTDNIGNNKASIVAVETDRLSIEHAHEMETILDAEYMPFYFHDLRTNEILSFPAFLKSLSDSYTVNTETGEFYGRIDPVKIYKNTTRSISMSFYIVATSGTDFDTMWLKINKLLTLIYPQWSEGNLLRDNNGNQFIQPFSQIMTSSPLIRIRLGDLLRSNYSRFALTRLFGAGGRLNLTENSTYEVKCPEFEALTNRTKDLPKGAKYDLQPQSYQSAPQSSLDSIAQGVASTIGSAVGVPITSKALEVNLLTTALIEIVKKFDNDSYIAKFVDTDWANKFPMIVVTKDVLSWPKGVNKTKPITQAPNETVNNEKVGFFDKQLNSIVRSFEQVSGKGLACMINSMNFEWLDFPWETEKYGGRAPKMCAVSFDLTPMHDIAPGIDSHGFNRAPVYNVGNTVNEFAGDSWDESGAGTNSNNFVSTERNKKIMGV
jgi:hypothetical protein